MSAPRKRLAIIGCGSSGLITLKTAVDKLSDWEIICFEKSARITGCWGNPYPGFVSTSTKYTTQFACFPKFLAEVDADCGQSRKEFFRDGEYGQYLEKFADHFSLKPHIVLQCQVESLVRTDDSHWELTINRKEGAEVSTTTERFDSVVLCTGLAAEPKEIGGETKRLTVAELNDPNGLGHIKNKRIVVVGGGESAVASRRSIMQIGWRARNCTTKCSCRCIREFELARDITPSAAFHPTFSAIG